MLLLEDTRNRVIDQETLYVGSLNTSLVRIAEVFRSAARAQLRCRDRRT